MSFERRITKTSRCNGSEPKAQEAVNRGGQLDIHRVLGNARVQAKLKIGPADDEHEREADRVAEQVVRMQAPPVSQKGISHSDMNVQRKCGACEREEEETVRRKPQNDSAGNIATADASHSVADLLPGSGRPLRESERNFFEPRFGSDFSAVRIHDDSTADRSARALQAKAFTVGNHIAFAAGKFQPESLSGRRLLAHELTHVVQQSMRGGWSAGSGGTEAEANAGGNRVASGQRPGVSHAAKSGQPQLAPDDNSEGEVKVIPKENGKIAVVLVKNGKILQGYAEITPPKGMSSQEAAAKIGIGEIRSGSGKPHVDVLLPSVWGPQAVNKRAPVQVLDQGALQRQHQQEQQAKVSQQLRTEMLQFFRWQDQQKGTDLAEQHAVNLRAMGYKSLIEYRQKYLAGEAYAGFVDAQNRARRDAAIRSQMSPQELEAGFTVEDVKELHDPTPELPPVLPEVSGRSGTRYTTEAETGLRYSKKLRHNGETYGYYQRWHVYVPGSGLQLREVYLDLDGKILKKQDRKIPATYETVIDTAIGVIPVVGDAVEIAELNYIAATGKDKWGNPVSDVEFGIRVAAVAIPGAIAGAIARKTAAKELAQRTGRAMGDEAEFLAEQARVHKLADGAQSPVLQPPPPPKVDVPVEQSSAILTPQPPTRYAAATDQKLMSKVGDAKAIKLPEGQTALTKEAASLKSADVARDVGKVEEILEDLAKLEKAGDGALITKKMEPIEYAVLTEKVKNPNNIRLPQKPYNQKYTVEVKVGDHTYRRRPDGTWCRFSLTTCGHHIDDGLDSGFRIIENRKLPDIGNGVKQTGRGKLKKRMISGYDGFQLPSWATNTSNWNAHHVIPWEFLDHGVFDVLRGKGLIWDHNSMKNAIALPTVKGVPGAENLPIHQVKKGVRGLQGHPVYNAKVKQRLDDILDKYELDPPRLQEEVEKLLVDLKGEIEMGGWAGVPQF